MTNNEKQQLEQINKEIKDYSSKLIILISKVDICHIDFYQVINDINHLKHKKQLILFDIASNNK